jgi:NodT family efflux transporter outer membrane factor (OMF) lipoprotein
LTSCVNYVGLHNKEHLRTPEQFTTRNSLSDQNGSWPSTDWAKQFDSQLPALIKEALTNNPDLRIAVSRLNQAQALVEARNASLLPSVDFLGLAARNKIIYPLIHPLMNFGLIATNVRYELDFWGKNYSLLAQALSEEKVRQADLCQSVLMLSTMIATVYNQLDYEYALQDLLRHTTKQRMVLNKITKQLFKSGLVTDVQVYQAQNAYADVNTQLVAVDGQIQIARQQLGILLGSGPERGFTIARPKFAVLADPKLPNSLPFNLLGRRPDIVATRWQVEASLYGVKNLKAQFYPDVDLLALAANFSLGSAALFRQSNHVLGGAAALSLPIFDGGSLKAQLKGRYAVLDEQIAMYNSTLNKALGDVAGQMTSIRSVDQQLKAQKYALSVSRKAFALAQKQYEIGLTSQIIVLDAEAHYLQEQQAHLLLIKSRRDLQIALIKALGGGFDELMLPTPRTTASPNHFLKKDEHV